jgi:hypothetical protein
MAPFGKYYVLWVLYHKWHTNMVAGNDVRVRAPLVDALFVWVAGNIHWVCIAYQILRGRDFSPVNNVPFHGTLGLKSKLQK